MARHRMWMEDPHYAPVLPDGRRSDKSPYASPLGPLTWPPTAKGPTQPERPEPRPRITPPRVRLPR